MKNAVKMFLCLTCICSQSFAQTTVFRAPGSSYPKYREAMLGNSFRLSPQDLMAARLKAADLPSDLRLKLDRVLLRVSEVPSETVQEYQSFLLMAQHEPCTLAVRETMKSVLEKLVQLTEGPARQDYLRQLATLSKTDGPVRGWNQNPTLLQSEIKASMGRLQALPGGEDAMIFWNGVKWSEQLPLQATDQGQWILISSQWKPRIIYGTWAEAQVQLHSESQNWVAGTCESPDIRDFGFAPNDKMAFFDFSCQGTGLTQAPIYHDTSVTSQTSFNTKKTLLWTAVAVGLGFLALSASGKKLRINSNEVVNHQR
ncbi:MAG: hypothetical protein ACK5P7_10065 [Bdellovibrio sp.]|jgi:hypothetical protein